MNEIGRSALDSTTFNLRNGSLSLMLRFSGRALAALKSEITSGFLSAARPGSETGGILMGEMAQQGSQWAVMVDTTIPAPIEYQYGPAYRLSAADKQRFRELAQAGDFASRPIGWYRGNTRPEKDIDEADRQISQTFFGASQSVFLFCEPLPDGSIKGNCLVMLPRRTEVAFPFELGEFSALDSLAASRPPGALPGESPEFPRFHQTSPAAAAFALKPAPLPETRIADPRFSSVANIAAARARPRAALVTPANLKIAAGIAVACAIVWYARGHLLTPASPTDAAPGSAAIADSTLPPRAPASATLDAPALGLRAQYQGNSLLLGWDRTSPFVAAAVSGAVTIADGSETRIIRLSARDLHTGSILYKPSADDIDVELAVDTASGATGSQSIRIIGAAPPAARNAAQSLLAVAPPPTAPQVIPHPARAATLFRPPPQTSAQPRSIATSDAPLITQTQPEPGTVLIPSTLALPPRPAAPAPVARDVATPPQTAARSSSPGPVPAGIAQRPSMPASFQAPVAIHAPQPAFPRDAGLPPNFLDRPFELKVEIHIDAKGRVTSARLAQDNQPIAAALASGAISAARSWTFRPGILDGTPIATTMILTFRYSKPAARD